jgi:hypothetical protein
MLGANFPRPFEGRRGVRRHQRKAAVGSSILDVIGNTPVVELSRVAAEVPGRIFAKLDYLNPGGSKKDRIALRLVKMPTDPAHFSRAKQSLN